MLLLEQQGKLSLDDDVRKYIRIKRLCAVIRLRHLLHHTSGIREWSNLEAITGWPRTTKAYYQRRCAGPANRQQHLNNVPGGGIHLQQFQLPAAHAYRGRVSGMRLPAFTKKYISTRPA